MITGLFNTQKDAYYQSLSSKERCQVVSVSADHVDGTMGASTRDEKLAWLKAVPANENEARTLSSDHPYCFGF